MAHRKSRRKPPIAPSSRILKKTNGKSGSPEREETQLASFPTTSGRLWPYMLAVLLFPLIVLWHNTNALYTPLWYADPWFYLGYFRNLAEFKRDLFYGFYYGDRLSWILPGYVVHAMFSPVIANAILHLIVQSTAALSFFSLLRLAAGVRSAFLATLVFSAHPWLWVATGWDYPDGAGIAYCLLAMALLTRSAAFPVKKWTLLLAGAALAGMVYTHLFLGTLAPLLVLYYIGLARAWHRIPVARSILFLCCWAGLGFGIVTLSFCGINYLLDGNLWFYAPSIRRAISMVKDFQFARSIWQDQQLAGWLWPALAGSITAIVLLLSHLRKAALQVNPVGGLFSLQLLLGIAYMAFLQSRGTTVLGHYPYASYLLPFVFLVLGVSFWPAAENMSFRTYLLICCVAAVTFSVLWYNPYGSLAPGSLKAQRAAIVLTAGSLAAALWWRHRAIGAWLALVGFASFTAMALAQTVSLGGLDRHGSREQYQRIMWAREQIEAIRQHRTVRFWWDRKEPNNHEYVGLNALYLEEFSQLGTSFPQGCNVPVDSGTLIAVLSQKDGAVELARTSLADCWRGFGMRPVVEAVRVVQRGDGPYKLILLSAHADVSANPSPEDLLQVIPLERVQPGAPKASLERKPEGLLVTTLPQYGAFAGRVALDLDKSSKARLAVYVRARVLQGKVGFAILDSAGRNFLLESSLRPSPAPQEVVLPLPSPPVTGDLIIGNRAGFASTALIERIEIRKMK